MIATREGHWLTADNLVRASFELVGHGIQFIALVALVAMSLPAWIVGLTLYWLGVIR